MALGGLIAPKLIDPDEAISPDDRNMIEIQNRNVTRGYKELNAELAAGKRPWIESNWDAPKPTAPVVGSANPLAILEMQTKAALDGTLSGITAQRRALEKSIELDRQTTYRDYLIDFQTLKDSNMDAGQKEERARTLYASYRKKALGVRDKIQGDLNTLDQAEQAAKFQAAFNQTAKQIKLQTIAEFGKKLGLGQEDILREQLQELGISVATKQDDAFARYRQDRAVYDEWRAILSNYRRDTTPKPLTLGEKWTNIMSRGQPNKPVASYAWKEFNPDTKKYDIEVPPDKAEVLTQIEAQMRAARPKLFEQERILFNRPSLGLLGPGEAKSPVGQAVTQARSTTPQRTSDPLGLGL